jgi:dephospho-CoA kinase
VHNAANYLRQSTAGRWYLCVGEIDRKKLGAIVFSDVHLRKQLNAATHPLVIMEMLKQLLVHWLLFRFAVVSSRRCSPLAPSMRHLDRSMLDRGSLTWTLLVRHAVHILWQVVDVPLLFEGGLDRFTSMNITVVSNPDTQRRRLMARDKSERAAAEARIAAQVCIL